MLTLTENASLIVKEIASQEGLPETAEPGDQVLQQDGATVYLDQDAATMLDDKVLDAAVDEGGRVEFALGVQG